VPAEVAKYQVDESTVVGFEFYPQPGWHPAGAEGIAGQVRDAIGPAVDAAKAVLDRLKEAKPDKVEVKFGVKVNGEANWLVAKAATEGSFEITLSWEPGSVGPVLVGHDDEVPDSGTAAVEEPHTDEK
jgi:Trypsin-co-occurring domain 1